MEPSLEELNPRTYPAGTPVHKYELGGVNLQRINRTHDLSDVTQADPFTFDSYKVKLDMSSTTGTDRSTDVGFPNFIWEPQNLLVDLV